MISVAIPAYNSTPFLRTAVKSIVEQTVKVEHIIIVDDVSKDNTPELIKQLQKEYPDFQIKYFRNDVNLGWQGNKNRCFDLCTTKYLIILHHDDILFPDMAEKLLNFHEANPEMAIAGGNAIIINQFDKVISQKEKTGARVFEKGQIYEFVTSTGSYIPFSSVMFEIEKLRKVGHFRTDVAAADEFFWPLALTKYPIGILGENLVYRKIHPNQAEVVEFNTKSHDTLKALLQFNQIENYETRPDKKKLLYDWYRKKVTNTLLYISISVIKAGGSSSKSRWFIWHALTFNFWMAIRRRNFYKSIFLNFLSILGIYHMLKKKRRK